MNAHNNAIKHTIIRRNNKWAAFTKIKNNLNVDCPEKILYLYIIRQAIKDIGHPSHYFDTTRWFDIANKDFIITCDAIDADPGYILKVLGDLGLLKEKQEAKYADH